MRTLKKTLCLALALVLCLGLASAGFAAGLDDFTDADEVGAQYEEAVAVLIGTGIVDGMAGEINPTDTFTREQAAKIITYMVLGKDIAEKLSTDTDPFSDVKADRWSAGYISYCVNEGIIVGFGDDTFRPTDELTGYQFAAMVLRALGFGLNGEYEGNGWTINVAKDAFTIGLFAGDAAAATNDSVQRQQAMLMAFNGLNYSAGGSSSQYIVFDDDNGNGKVDSGETVYYRGTSALDAMVIASAQSADMIYETVNTSSLGYTVYGLTEGTKSDDFGRVSKTYTNGKSGKDEVVYASFEPTAVLTYTAATTYGKIVSALGYKAGKSVTFEVYENSSTKSSDQTATIATDTAVGGQGTLVEVYATNTADTYQVVIVETKVKQLAAGDITAANAATGAAAYITLETGFTYETSAFVKDDVVLYTKNESKVVNVVKASYVSGTITAVGAGNAYIRIDGTLYYPSKNIDGTIGTNYKLGDTGVYYLDGSNNVIFKTATAPADVEKNFVYVYETAAKAAGSTGGDDLFGTGAETTAAQAQARIVDLSSGEVKVVNLGIVQGTDGKYYYADQHGAATATEVTNVAPIEAVNAGVYEYNTLADGSYVIGSKQTGKNLAVTKGSATVKVGDVSYFANNSTTLTIVEHKADKTSAVVTKYTGYANFPAISETGTAYIVANDTTKAVSAIVVVKPYSVTTAANYAIYKGAGETTSEGTKMAFYVGGEVVEYLEGTIKNASLTADTVYDITVTNGKVDVATAATALQTSQTVTIVTEEYVVVNGTAYYFAEGCGIYDKDNNYAADTISVNDVITVYGTDTNAALIIIDNP